MRKQLESFTSTDSVCSRRRSQKGAREQHPDSRGPRPLPMTCSMEVAMPIKKLREFLDGQDIKYVTISHPVAYTAQEIAAVTHISSKEMAKTVVVKIDSALAMAVLPASYEVDLSLLKAATGARTLSLAKEAEFKDRFP